MKASARFTTWGWRALQYQSFLFTRINSLSVPPFSPPLGQLQEVSTGLLVCASMNCLPTIRSIVFVMYENSGNITQIRTGWLAGCRGKGKDNNFFVLWNNHSLFIDIFIHPFISSFHLFQPPTSLWLFFYQAGLWVCYSVKAHANQDKVYLMNKYVHFLSLR